MEHELNACRLGECRCMDQRSGTSPIKSAVACLLTGVNK